MDFFLSGPCPLAKLGERPVPGAVFDTHDKALDFWHARLADGSLTAPFDVYDDYRQFRQTGYDFVAMAQSPRYAPRSADRIMEIVRRYIVEAPVVRSISPIV